MLWNAFAVLEHYRVSIRDDFVVVAGMIDRITVPIHGQVGLKGNRRISVKESIKVQKTQIVLWHRRSFLTGIPSVLREGIERIQELSSDRLLQVLWEMEWTRLACRASIGQSNSPIHRRCFDDSRGYRWTRISVMRLIGRNRRTVVHLLQRFDQRLQSFRSVRSRKVLKKETTIGKERVFEVKKGGIRVFGTAGKCRQSEYTIWCSSNRFGIRALTFNVIVAEELVVRDASREKVTRQKY